MELICTKTELSSLIRDKVLTPLDGDTYEMKFKNVFDKEVVLVVTSGSTTSLPETQAKLELNTVNREDVESWIKDWRLSWRGLAPKSQGVLQTCIDKMINFMEKYPEYTKDVIYEARDRYFAQLNGDYSYLEHADNFIKKRVPDLENGGTKIRSTLTSYCEEVLQVKELGEHLDNFIDNNDGFELL